ncbi:putative heme iron utilization protein [Neorhizobium galegae]|uniref:HugZ family pyridoxamine 5'-phosphate oxidase n=1 Tax=Neorhizobium galegae TaxID=399 RepID=UPI001AE9D03A|nr:putative heme iron utilization protein [Neorhizobium galegae]
MSDKPSVLRDTDEAALKQARCLVRAARSVSLGVLDPETGFPQVSRALVATDLDGVPIILVSQLAGHTRSLEADPRCSLLAGEPGKGDPLAHPRITVSCTAEAVARDGDDHFRIRMRFLNRHPKASLYIDFPDFRFFRLIPQLAALNGGFGRAYRIDGSALFFKMPEDLPDWLALQETIIMQHSDVRGIAAAAGARDSKIYRICGVDPAGFDLICPSNAVRHEFSSLCRTSKDAQQEIDIILKAV